MPAERRMEAAAARRYHKHLPQSSALRFSSTEGKTVCLHRCWLAAEQCSIAQLSQAPAQQALASWLLPHTPLARERAGPSQVLKVGLRSVERTVCSSLWSPLCPLCSCRRFAVEHAEAEQGLGPVSRRGACSFVPAYGQAPVDRSHVGGACRTCAEGGGGGCSGEGACKAQARQRWP